MRKVFLNCMLLLCALIVGSGSVWADETYTLTPDQSSTGSGATTYITTLTEFTHSGISWKMNQWNPKTLQVKTNQSSATSEFRFYNTSAFPRRIKQVVITFSALTVSDASKLMFKGGTSEVSVTTGGTAGTWNGTAKTLTWTPGESDNYTYFAFYQDGKAASATNYLASSNAIVVTYESAASATALSVKTAPTKLNYKKGETLDLTNLVLDATVGGNHVDVTSGYTASPANGATLNSVGAQTVTFTYGGQSTTQTIHVGDLESIALTTTGVKTTYDEGQSFDPTNLVVTATYSDGEDTPTTWTEDVTASCTYDPDGALDTGDDKVTVSYTFGSKTETADIALTINAASAYTVTFNKGTGTCETSSLTEASAKTGVELPTATIGVTGWSFAGWATTEVTNTEDEPTLYAAGATYKPIEDCTLYAVYKFTETSATTYKRATSVSDITSASSVVIVCNNQSKVLDNTLASAVTAPTETSSKITASAKDIFTLTGNNTAGYTLTNSTTTVGATSTDNSTVISNTTTNDLWVVKAHGTTNTFYFENKGKSNLCLEYYNSSGYKWMVYAPNTPSTNAAVAMKVYVPVTTTVYNSTPAAIVNPTIAWTTSGDKKLYLKNTSTYDNPATVTGISKTASYTSSDATVASVSEAGVVTALKVGSTTITAKVAKEVGVNTEASVTYDVTVKDASNIAGIKAITSSSDVVAFTADLTDAVVTYKNGNHAYIQDASGAIYASCGSSLTAGKKINGAVSGSVKAANQIDEITAIDLSDATVTDGVIPSAAVISAATLAANKADYEGKLVSIEGATVTASLASGSASGGKISDDSKTTEINLYAPDSNIDALKDAEGTFNGYITLYGGSTIRFNIYEQSQITLTKNAPTDQPLTFESDAVELDEATSAYSAFTGQSVSGAKGTVTYSKVSDASSIVTSVNASTGAVVLSGNYGTATIQASAAKVDDGVDEHDIPTPWKATTKTYTITVYPRYIVTFSVNGDTTKLRQTAHGAAVAVPSDPADIGDYKFQGWSTSSITATNTKPTMADLGSTVTPESNSTYYAVFAIEGGSPIVEHKSFLKLIQSSAPSTPYVVDGSSWTWSNLTFTTDNNGAGACINSSNGTVTFTLPSGGKATSVKIVKTSNAWAGAAEVVLEDASSNTLKTFSLGNTSSDTYSFTAGSHDQSASYTLTNSTSKNAWTDSIVFRYTTGGITYSDYRSLVPLTIQSTQEGYATFYAPYKVTLPTADVNSTPITVTASIGVYDEDKKELTLYNFDGGVIPEKTPVILKSTGGNVKYTVTPTGDTPSALEDGDADLEDNDLHGTAKAKEVQSSASEIYYVLARQDGNTGFYKLSSSSKTTIPAYRAYLTLNGSGAAFAGGIRIVEAENNATSIENIEATDKAVKFFENGVLYIRRAGVTYDAMGRLVQK